MLFRSYAQLLSDKKKAYGEYRQARAAMRELLTVKNNVDRVLAMEQTEPQQKEKDHGQRRARRSQNRSQERAATD